MYYLVMTRVSNLPISQFSRPCNEFKWSCQCSCAIPDMFVDLHELFVRNAV